MSKHSPGPWQWTRDELENQAPDRVVDADGRCVIEVPWLPRREDARLIAAAPRMLEMLRGVLRGMDAEELDPVRALIAEIDKP